MRDEIQRNNLKSEILKLGLPDAAKSIVNEIIEGVSK
jgi:hypothetical protein